MVTEMSVPTDAAVPSSRSATSWVVLGAGVAGVATYLFQVVGTRALGTEAYAPISVLWTMQYLVFAVGMVAVEAYVTRGTTLHPHTLARDVRVVAAWLVAAAVVVGAISFVLRDQLFEGLGDLAAIAALIVLAFGSYAVVRGRLAGAERFRLYGIVTVAEAGIRVVLAVIVVAVAASTRSLAWVLPVGPLAIAAWWGLTHRRSAAAAEPLVGENAAVEAANLPSNGHVAGATNRFLAATGTANAAAQVLLAGGPLVLLPLGAGDVEVSVFFVTITAARTPISFALGGVFGRILPPLTRMSSAGDQRGLRRILLGVTGVTIAAAVVGGFLAGVVGDDLVAAFFGAEFRPGRSFVMLAGAGVLLATGGLLLNQILIATRAERRMPLPWLAGLLCAAVVIVVAGGTPTLRVAAGFAAGEIVALTGLTLAALRATPQ